MILGFLLKKGKTYGEKSHNIGGYFHLNPTFIGNHNHDHVIFLPSNNHNLKNIYGIYLETDSVSYIQLKNRYIKSTLIKSTLIRQKRKQSHKCYKLNICIPKRGPSYKKIVGHNLSSVNNRKSVKNFIKNYISCEFTGFSVISLY